MEPNSNQTTYPYLPITPDSGFRVLVLHPSSHHDSDIHCELVDAQLKDHPPYEALSYTWGISQCLTPLKLDGHDVHITKNLDTALRYLRYKDASRYLWVDALCIDQSNLQERSNHVGYMKDVYARCTGDILWLGEDESVLSDGLRAMDYWGSLIKMNDELSNVYYIDDNAYGQLQVDAIEGLFAKPAVWKRVWIMQEIAFAPNVTLIAGHLTMSWDRVEEFLAADHYIKRYGIPGAFHGWFSHELSIRTIASGVLAYPQILAHQRRVVRTGATGYGSTLLDVLARFRHTNSTDPRDKIYALLGLCADDVGIKVDYGRPVREIYIDCMRVIIEHNGHLDFLCQAPWELYGNKERDPDLPSWVCDFDHPGNAAILFAQRDIFNAGGDDVRLPLDISPDGILRLQGFALGFFVSIRGEHHRGGNPPYPPFSSRAMSSMPNSLLQEGIESGNSALSQFLRDEQEPIHTPISSATSFQDYCRTQVLDCKRSPMRRLNDEEAKELDLIFQEWFSKPLDDTREMDLDFKIQGLVYPYHDWDFSVSDQGLYCMAPKGAEAGDKIVVVKGAKVPLVLRLVPQPSDTASEIYQFIGPCYVHGFMDGQVFELAGGLSHERCFEIS